MKKCIYTKKYASNATFNSTEHIFPRCSMEITLNADNIPKELQGVLPVPVAPGITYNPSYKPPSRTLSKLFQPVGIASRALDILSSHFTTCAAILFSTFLSSAGLPSLPR